MIWPPIRRRSQYPAKKSPNWIAAWRLTAAIPARSPLGRPFSSGFSARLLAVSELVFLLSAETDIQAAFEFYEAFQAGRGEIFMRHLDVAFGQVRAFPEIAPLFHEPHRRLLVRGFPYGIFYTVEGRRIIISGVMDLRQDP